MCLAAWFGFVLPQIYMRRLYLLGTGKFETLACKSHPCIKYPRQGPVFKHYTKNTLLSPLTPVSSTKGWHNRSFSVPSACSDGFITLGVVRSSSSLLPPLCSPVAGHIPDPIQGSSRAPFPGNHRAPGNQTELTEPLSGPKCHGDISPSCI